MDLKKLLFKNNALDIEKSLPDALFICSKDGKIQWVNDVAAEIFETSKMHLMTSNISDFIENAQIMINNSLSSGTPVITKLNGKEQYYDMTTRENNDCYVLDFRDTKQNNLSPYIEEEKPEIINREKNNFLLKLSNDLKSPLQSIVGFSQAMTDGLGGNLSIQQEKYVKIINKNSSELMYFISKLLEHSQTELSTNKPEKKQMDILALVNTIIKYNEQLYKDKEINVNIKQSDNFKKMINSDYDILKNILQDTMEVIFKAVDMGEVSILLSNPDEEFLKTKKLPIGNYTLISISSSALLLSENDLECLFDPYKIVDSTNRKNVLRAMILASIQNYLKLLNGYIWVESEILKNTNFNIIIPE